MTYANPLPALDKRTETELRESIKSRGVVAPVIVDQHGAIIDGHNRQRIAAELGQDIPVHAIDVSPEVREELEITLNTVRRHLTVEQRAVIVKRLAAKGMTERAIAGALKVGKGTIGRDKAAAPNGASATPRPKRKKSRRDANTRPALTESKALATARMHLVRIGQLLGKVPDRAIEKVIEALDEIAEQLTATLNPQQMKGNTT
jgi:transposase